MKTIVQISDCHFNLNKTNAKEELEHTLDFINSLNFDYLFITGDICESPSIQQYETFSRLISDHVRTPNIYAIAGNHDCIDMMKSAFTGTPIKVAEQVPIETFDFMFIDSSKKPKKTMMLGAGRVASEDIKRIDNAEQETVIVIHHPIFENDCDWFNAIGLENQKEVATSVLNNENIQHIICGHGHSFIQTKRQHTTQIMSPSTSYGFDHGSKVFLKNDSVGAVMIEVGETITSQEITIPSRVECQ